MEQVFFNVPLSKLEPIFKRWIKEAQAEIQPIQVEPTDQQTKKEFITRKETQALFSVSSVTIHEWQKNGILKVYKMGNRSYFKYSELLETLYKSNRL